MKLINADTFLASEIERCGGVPVVGTCTVNNISLKERVKAFPAVDAEPVKKGKWIFEGNHLFIDPCFKCSNCHNRRYEHYANEFKYCPDCGAKMDRKES